jgi:hypothetical protein
VQAAAIFPTADFRKAAAAGVEEGGLDAKTIETVARARQIPP